MQRDIVVGTGYYAKGDWMQRAEFFYSYWIPNTNKIKPRRIVTVNNMDAERGPRTDFDTVHIWNNLGHAGDPIHGNQLMGWSMSWIITAFIAYSENCDFVYKEQDCLAFGDWLPQIRQGRISFGYNSRMPCEQSLFYIERNTIPAFISEYIAIKETDKLVTSEEKMLRASHNFDPHRFNMPFGRERPLQIFTDRPWYAQRITPEEIQQIKEAKLL